MVNAVENPACKVGYRCNCTSSRCQHTPDRRSRHYRNRGKHGAKNRKNMSGALEIIRDFIECITVTIEVECYSGRNDLIHARFKDSVQRVFCIRVSQD